MTVVALVPAKDRADSVAATVRALSAIVAVDRVLVIDDGSSDDTAERALAAGADVLRLGANRGKSGAIAAGVEATADADVYLLIDADVGDDAAEASRLLDPVLDGDADMTIGVLPAAGSRGGFGLVRRFSHWGVVRGCGVSLRAPLSGQRAVRADLLRSMRPSRRFGLEVAMTIDLARAGARVVEVDVDMGHRFTGRSVAGFAHRAGQGRDIAFAFWTRLVPGFVRRGLPIVCVLALIALSTVTVGARRPSAGQPLDRVRHVVLFGVPRLGFDALTDGSMPNLARLAETGSTGAMSVRAAGRTRPESAYATLGAGFRVGVGPNAGVAVPRDVDVEGSPAIDVLERRTGHRPDGTVVVPGLPTILRRAGAHVESRPGALGDALRGAGLRGAVVANSGTADTDGAPVRAAPAALAVMNGLGTVDDGDVSDTLLRDDPTAPFGRTVDEDAFVSAFERVVATNAVTVVDPGETDRVTAFAPGMLDRAADVAFTRARNRTDRILGAVVDRLPADTLLVVVGVTPPTPRPALTPVVVAGPGVPHGTLQSPSTGRNGLVVLTDLGPTVLASLGVPTPPGMIGSPLRADRVVPDTAAFERLDTLTMARNGSYGGFQSTFLDLQILLYVVATVLLLRGDLTDGVRRGLRIAFVAMAAVPVATFVARIAAVAEPLAGAMTTMTFLFAGVAAWWLAGRGRDPLDPLYRIATIGVILLVADLLAGAPLQQSSLLAYSPTAAARFSGLGNAAFAVLAASTVLVVVRVVDRATDRVDAWWVAAALCGAAVLVDGLPWLGADVGGILSLVPAFGILLLLFAGRRPGLRWILGLGAAAVVVLGAVIGYEASRPPAERDHIGRFFLGGTGGGTFWTTLARKLSTNVRLLFSSPWSQLLPVIGAFVALMYLFGRRWDRMLPVGSPRRIGLVGLGLVALLGYATNDSGAMAAALVLVTIGAYVGLLLADDVPDPVLVRAEDRPSGEVG